MAGKKNIFDLYNEQNPEKETAPDEKIVVREPDEDKVVKAEKKEEPKTETVIQESEPNPDAVQEIESEGAENV